METKQHATKQSVGKQRNKSDQEYLETNENGSTKSMRHSKSSAKKEAYRFSTSIFICLKVFLITFISLFTH